MSAQKLDKITTQMENYLECWKQFNQFMNLSRLKKFGNEEEAQFLEVKSILVQQLELLLASLEVSSPSREDVHTLIGNAPSLRYLSELNEGIMRNLENQWHKIYIGWQAILGQLRVRQQQAEMKSGGFASLFARR